MKFGVVIFPGSNCDMDMIYLIKNILNQNVVKIWHKDESLKNCDFIILPGGFSFGDYLRSGAIANYSNIMKKIVDFANNGGYVMGICNGFQILCESGLLPGTLLHNTNHKFICKNIFIKAATKNSLMTNKIDKPAIKIPIAHGEGRFYANEEQINEICENDQILFKYCDKNGKETIESNPNGSLLNIAGICNKNRNVFGMMPHPERASDIDLNNTDGEIIFQNILNSIQ